MSSVYMRLGTSGWLLWTS